MSLTRRQFLAAAPAVAVGAGAAVTLAQTGGWLRGIDVSHYQSTINWNSVKNAGTTFAVTKATEGTSYRDPSFLANWNGMKAAGIIRGAYHFARPGTDPVAQANYFINYVRPIRGDLQLMLDLEATDGKTKSQVWAWTQAFVNRVKAKTGRPCLMYTGFYFLARQRRQSIEQSRLPALDRGLHQQRHTLYPTSVEHLEFLAVHFQRQPSRHRRQC